MAAPRCQVEPVVVTIVKLDDLIEKASLADAKTLSRSRDRASQQGQTLLQVLVEQEGIADEVVADLLAEATDGILIDIDRGELDHDAVALLSAATARRYGMIPVGRDPASRRLQIAFSDPLDASAVEAAQRETGWAIEPLVAPLLGVLRLIERFYGRAPAPEGAGGNDRDRVGDGGGEAPGPVPDASSPTLAAPRRERSDELHSEATQRLDARARQPIPETPTETRGPLRSSTIPLRRIDDDATPEQRHEALLLALIEAGAVTRADYVAVLKRLLGGKG